jgi:thioredoxin reductase (NADPH)
VLRSGQFVGELTFLSGGDYFLAMRAASRTVVVEVARAVMLDLMARVPELSDQVITVFAARRQQHLERQTTSIRIIGSDRDPSIQKVEAFLSRNRVPFQSFDLESRDPEAARLRELFDGQAAVVFGRDRRIEDPTPREVARELNMNFDIGEDTRIDILIVGGGPAGVAAAVNAGAEGVPALVVEDAAIGGQAGASSRIENYMGFPTGISGADLVFRGQIQALKFGACFAMPRRVEQLAVAGDGSYCATLDDGARVLARAVLVATGVQYHRLELDGLERFENAGVFYAATESEARFCRDSDAVVVGGGNSAGQAAMYLSRYARHVHVLVRGDDLSDTMSSYLLQRLEAKDNVEIHFGTEVTALRGDDHLEGVTVRSGGEEQDLPTRALFTMIGASPNTDWLSGLVELDDRGFVRTGDVSGGHRPHETSRPGVFAVGDVRARSVKRVASAAGEGSVVVPEIYEFLAGLAQKQGEPAGGSDHSGQRSGDGAMRIQENVQTVKDFFEAIGSGDQEALKKVACEDIEWIIPGEDWPLAGTRRGYAGLEDLLKASSEEMETTSMDTREYVAQGDRVMVVGVAEGKVKATGKAWKDDWVFAITVRDGKLTNIREYVDTQALARAAVKDTATET